MLGKILFTITLYFIIFTFTEIARNNLNIKAGIFRRIMLPFEFAGFGSIIAWIIFILIMIFV